VIKDVVTRLRIPWLLIKDEGIAADLIADARRLRFCGPSNDPDEQTDVTSNYRYLVTQFKKLAASVFASPFASWLNAIEVEIDKLYSAYDGKAELDTLLPEIETALGRLDDDGDLSVLMARPSSPRAVSSTSARLPHLISTSGSLSGC